MKKMTVALALVLSLSMMVSCQTSPESTDDGEDQIKSSHNTDNMSGDVIGGNSNEDESQNGDGSDKTDDTKVKIDDVIVASSIYSEGLALVEYQKEKGATYCIDKEGYVVFRVEEDISTNGEIYSYFKNGLVSIKEALCDTTGKLTYPEDVGASTFSDFALSEGYIIATVVTADYDSSVKKLGIMNTAFEWVVEPTEALHEKLSNEYGEFTLHVANNDYCDDGWVYVAEKDCYLELKTGKTYTREEANRTLPSSEWVCYLDQTYRTKDGDEICLDMSGIKNIVGIEQFNERMAPIAFYNSSVPASYFTLIDEEGNFQFDPIQVGQFATSVNNIKYDGENILVIDSSHGADRIELKCYSSRGELLGSYSTDGMEYMSYTAEINDGVVILRGGYNYTTKYYHYNTDFSPLY